MRTEPVELEVLAQARDVDAEVAQEAQAPPGCNFGYSMFTVPPQARRIGPPWWNSLRLAWPPKSSWLSRIRIRDCDPYRLR